jgi:hypothetical protein
MNVRPFLLSACVVLVSGAATAAGFQWLAEKESWTEPAGASSANTAQSLVTADYYGLQALKLWDFDARTCSLQIEQSSLNAPNPRPLDPVRYCEPKRAQEWQRADVGTGNFVTALATCTAFKGSGEIHGVELWGAALDANGKLKPAKSSVKIEFPHCEKWSSKRACPAGSVATGIKVSLADADGGAVGLALRCNATGQAK